MVDDHLEMHQQHSYMSIESASTIQDPVLRNSEITDETKHVIQRSYKVWNERIDS